MLNFSKKKRIERNKKRSAFHGSRLWLLHEYLEILIVVKTANNAAQKVNRQNSLIKDKINLCLNRGL